MSDLLSKIYDLYEEYKLLCKEEDIEAIDILDGWYTHFTILRDRKQLKETENE